MTIAVRKIERRALWDRAGDTRAGIDADDLAADALNDVRTDENRLSVYLVDSVESPMLNRVVAALAASREHLQKLDYAIFDVALLDRLDIRTERCDGDTLDPGANAVHVDLVELSATKLTRLAVQIRLEGGVYRRRVKEVRDLIELGIRENHIDRSLLKPNLAKDFV